jgi:hypothetical protein
LVEHLHGKEGVDGSSPSEGLNTCKTALLKTAESLLIKEGTGGPGQRAVEKSLQIGLLSAPTEHLLDTEGVEDSGLAGVCENAWMSGVPSVFPRVLR